MSTQTTIPTFLTVGDVSRSLGAPEWLVRRLADKLGLVRGMLGGYRLLLPEDQDVIASEIQRRSMA